jgi:hypothetical protein
VSIQAQAAVNDGLAVYMGKMQTALGQCNDRNNTNDDDDDDGNNDGYGNGDDNGVIVDDSELSLAHRRATAAALRVVRRVVVGEESHRRGVEDNFSGELEIETLSFSPPPTVKPSQEFDCK